MPKGEAKRVKHKVPKTQFVADYHETEECGLAVYLLGLVSIEWNMVEHMTGALIWNYVGGHETGLAVTANLGNKSRADMLLSLCRKVETDPEIIERIDSATKAFNVLRDNRNVLVHSHSITPHKSGKLEWRRTSTKAPRGHVGSLADVADLDRIRGEICELGKFVTLMYIHTGVERGKPTAPLPDPFPLPTRLKQLPFEISKTKKLRRR